MLGENVAQETKQFQLWLNQMFTRKDLSWVIDELKCLHGEHLFRVLGSPSFAKRVTLLAKAK